MDDAIKVAWTVYDASAPGKRSEESLSFTDNKSVTVGKRKFKASDLQEAPTVTGDSVELRTNSLRVVAKSTRETRRLGAEIDEAYRNRNRSGKADPKAKGRKGAGSQATPAKRPMAYRPTNTLGQVSRPGFGGGGGGKRGKLMAAKAATGGAGRGMQRGVGVGVSGVGVSGMVSSGKVRRRQGSGSDSEEVEEVEEPRGRRRSDDGHEQISDPEEEASNAKGSSSSSNNNKGAGSDYASSTDGGSRTQNNILGYLGSSTSSSSSNNNRVAGLPESSARKAGRGGGIHDTTWPRAGAGSTRQFRPPRFRGPAAVDGRPGGTPGGGWLGAQQLDRYRVHREPVSRREGFRNMGNTCYLNACLQGLLSLSGFVGDLQRKCWVLAMLQASSPLPEEEEKSGRGQDGGSDTAIDIRDSPDPREVTPPAAGGGGARDGGGKPILYDALLRLSLVAKGSHGLMDASPLKRAMDRHSDRFAGNLQQDAHEFLSDLVNVLHDETRPRLDKAAAYVEKQQQPKAAGSVVGRARVGETTAAARRVTAGQGDGNGRMTFASGKKVRKSGTTGGGGGGGGDVGGDGGAMVVDLSAAGSGDEGGHEQEEKLDPYGGGWDNDEDLAAAAAAAVDAAAAAAAAAAVTGVAAAPGSRAASSAVEVLEVDSDSDDDGGGTVGVSSRPSAPIQATPTLPRGPAEENKGGTEAVGEGSEREGKEGLGEVSEPPVALVAERGEKGEQARRREGAEKELALRERERKRERERERLMPTTRHFHAEVEVVLTCTRCSYSRRRRELYRDFSLDIPDPAARQQHQTEKGGGGGRGVGGGAKGGASGLESLLEGFFQPSELNLRCERCGHDRVRAEHSLAELPGALVLHIKRFKPVMNTAVAAPGAASAKATSSSSSPGIIASSSTSSSPPSAGNPPNAPTAAGDSGGDVATPPVAVVGGGSTGKSSQSGGSGGSLSYGSVSYVKLTAPVSVPLELSLERFCTDFTGNAPPAQGLDLGEAVGSLDGLAGIRSMSAPPEGGATRRSGRSTATAAAAAAAAGDKSSSSDGISVDLSMREGWSSGGAAGGAAGESGAGEGEGGDDPFRFPSPLGTVREEEEEGGARSGMGARGRAGLGAGSAKKKLASVLHDSTNSSSGTGSVVGGVRETATEKSRRLQKEKENAASAVGDRWSDQDQDKQSHKSNNHRTNRDRKRHTADGVCLDANRNVDYLATLSSGNASITARGSPAAGRARGLFPSSGGGGGGGGPSSGGSGRHVGDRPGFSSSTLRGTDAMSGTLLMQKKRRRQQELDAQEREEFAAAIAASQLETSALRGACQGIDVDDQDAELARAIHMSMSQEEQDRSGSGSGSSTRNACANSEWVCPACTLVNDGISSKCSVCSGPKPELAPGTAALDAWASGEGDAMDEGGREGENGEAVPLGSEPGATVDALPSPSGGGGGSTQDQRPKQRNQQKHVELDQKSAAEESEEEGAGVQEGESNGEERGSSAASPDPQPRIPRKGRLSARYELRGILHHLGQHAFAGHYVTDIRQEEPAAGVVGSVSDEGATAGKGSGAKGRGWKRHDDSVVATVSEATALDGAAQRTCYICFYSLVVG